MPRRFTSTIVGHELNRQRGPGFQVRIVITRIRIGVRERSAPARLHRARSSRTSQSWLLRVASTGLFGVGPGAFSCRPTSGLVNEGLRTAQFGRLLYLLFHEPIQVSAAHPQ